MSTAALVALAKAVDVPEDRVAEACLAAKGSADPLMLDKPDAVLWAPRAAKVLPAATAIATTSAKRPTALRGPLGDPIATLAARLGALFGAVTHRAGIR
jgi:hypothetical protein